MKLTIPTWLENRLNELNDKGGYCLTKAEEKEYEVLQDLSMDLQVKRFKVEKVLVWIGSNMGFNNYSIRQHKAKSFLKHVIYSHAAANDWEPNEHLKVFYAATPALEKEFNDIIAAAERQYPKQLQKVHVCNNCGEETLDSDTCDKCDIDEDIEEIYNRYEYL